MELPEGWAWVTLGDVCDRGAKWDPHDFPAETFSYVDIGAIDRQRVTGTKRLAGAEAPSRARQLVRAGDTILSTVRTYLRNTAFVTDELDGATVSTGFCVLRPTQAIDARFLFHRVLEDRFVEHISSLQTGTSYPAVRDGDVLDVRIALPPLAEQRRIVAAIDMHLSRRDAATQVLARAAKRLEQHRAASLLRITSGWPERPLGEFSNVFVGATPRRQSPELWGGGVPWVSSGEISFCRILTTRETISQAGLTSSDRLHPPGRFSWR